MEIVIAILERCRKRKIKGESDGEETSMSHSCVRGSVVDEHRRSILILTP